MKSLLQFINESINKLPYGKTGIVVFDIDDTLIQADEDVMSIGKFVDGDRKHKISLSTEEFAKDPDAKEHKDWFDFSDFQNPQKVVQSIIKGTPLLKNLRILDAYLNAGYEFCFLTARGCEDAVKYAIQTVIKYRDDKGVLNNIAPYFNKDLSAAINDSNKEYDGHTDAEKKSNVLKEICSKFDYVVFVDDDNKNVAQAKELNLNNLTVIKAWTN
jgi:FMN phosphatase YigB (HAD superfamily)